MSVFQCRTSFLGSDLGFGILYLHVKNNSSLIGNGFHKFFIYLLKKLGWKEEAARTWYPKCLEELLDLPCILILSGDERSGETFPR